MPDSATKLPPLRRIICGTTAWARMKAPSSATDMISRHSASGMSRKAVCRRSPAFETAMSTPPHSASTAAAMRATAAGSEISARQGIARPPMARISAATASIAA